MNSRACVLVDTNVVSYAMLQSPLGRDYDALIAASMPCIALVTAEELYFGAMKDRWGERRSEELESFTSRYVLLSPNRQIARRSATIRTERRRIGRPISKSDAWIGATALHYDLPLVSHDRDFEGIEGLELLTVHRGPGCTSTGGYRELRERRLAA